MAPRPFPLSQSPAQHADESPHDGLPLPQRYWALVTVFCAVALSVTSTTSVSVALPVIASSLGVRAPDAIAIVNLYQLTLVATLLPFAALGEKIGYRRVSQYGLILMGVASLACAWAPSLHWLIAARVLQALSGSAIMAMNPALLRLSVPTSQLGWAIGFNATVVAVFTALGPSIAAMVLTLGNWHWLFLINLPWGLLALLTGARSLPRQGGDAGPPFDRVGALLNIAMFVFLFTGLRELLSHPALACGLLIVGGMLLRTLLLHQRDRKAPLLPLDLLRIPVVRFAVTSSICAFAAQLAAMVALPFLLHSELGHDIVETGVLVMAWPVAVAIMASGSSHLLKRFSSTSLSTAGSVTFCTGLLLAATLPAHTGMPWIACTLALCGLGFGCFQTPNNRAMIGATPHARSGSAGGMQATARLCGQTLGTTLAAICFQALPFSAPRDTLMFAAALAGCSALASRRRSNV